MGASVTGDWTGGGICADVRNVLHHGGSGGATLRVGVVAHVPTNWEGAVWISPSDDMEADGADSTEERGQ